MIEVGQYVRAVLAEGIAAVPQETEELEPQMHREGVVVQLRPAVGTFVLEDYFENEHVCHLNSAVIVDPTTLDSYLHGWVAKRARELGRAA